MKAEIYKREKDKKSKRKWLILAIILIFVIYVILKFVKIPLTSEVAISGSVPYETEQLSQEPKLEKTQQCYMQEFNWDYAWQDWADLDGDKISPIFWIINYEDRSGTFDIRFAFIDNTAYPFDRFRSRGYNDFKDELSEDAIAVHSEWATITLGPRENQTITIPTKAPNPDHAYWALADVNEPKPYEVCTSDTTEEDLTQEKNVTKYKNTTERIVMKESISLWDFLLSKI